MSIRTSFILSVCIGLVVHALSLTGFIPGGPITPLFYLFIVIMLFSVFTIRFGKPRRAVIRDCKKWLGTLSFGLENAGDYCGYKGTYRGYFTRVFIHPKSRSDAWSADLCIVVYFQPMRLADGKSDIALLRRVQADLYHGIFTKTPTIMDCHEISIAQYTPFTIFTTLPKVQKRLEQTVEKVMKHGLRPMPESEVEFWIDKDPDQHGPQVRSFQESRSTLFASTK